MTIGILGGMGSYATLDIFRRILEEFPAEKEWDRPRIVIDNNCTMPSRVVAALYGKDKEKLIDQMSMSLKGLVLAGCTHIFFACNTSHIFLDDVCKNVPEAKDKIINIIETLAEEICISKEIGSNEKIALVATEGTIQTEIYQNIFSKYNLEIQAPNEEKYSQMRDIIEAVKQNCLLENHAEEFISLVKDFNLKSVILGCTEFPVLYNVFKKKIDSTGIKIYDPVESTIKYLRRKFLEEQK